MDTFWRFQNSKRTWDGLHIDSVAKRSQTPCQCFCKQRECKCCLWKRRFMEGNGAGWEKNIEFPSVQWEWAVRYGLGRVPKAEIWRVAAREAQRSSTGRNGCHSKRGSHLEEDVCARRGFTMAQEVQQYSKEKTQLWWDNGIACPITLPPWCIDSQDVESPKYSLSFSSQFILTTKVETALYYFFYAIVVSTVYQKKRQLKEKKERKQKKKEKNDRWGQILEGKVRRWLVSSRHSDPVFNLKGMWGAFSDLKSKKHCLKKHTAKFRAGQGWWHQDTAGEV